MLVLAIIVAFSIITLLLILNIHTILLKRAGIGYMLKGADSHGVF